MLKRKGGKNSDRVITGGKSDQIRIVEEAYEDSCDVLTADSGNANTQMLGYLTRLYISHMPKKRVVQYLQVL